MSYFQFSKELKTYLPVLFLILWEQLLSCLQLVLLLFGRQEREDCHLLGSNYQWQLFQVHSTLAQQRESILVGLKLGPDILKQAPENSEERGPWVTFCKTLIKRRTRCQGQSEHLGC